MRRILNQRLSPRCLTLVILACVLSTSSATAQLTPVAAADAALVDPFVSDTTFLILKVEPELLAFSDLAGAVDTLPPDTAAAYRSLAEQFSVAKKQMTTVLDGSAIYGTVGLPVSKTRVPVSFFVRKKSDDHGQKLLAFANQLSAFNADDRNGFIVATPAHLTEPDVPFSRSFATPPEVIAAAFGSISDYPAKLLIVPPEYVRRTFRELSPELPPQLGGGPSSVLTDGVQWAAIGFDLTRFRVEIVVQSASADAANAFAERLPTILNSLHASAPDDFKQRTTPLAQPLLASLQPEVDGDQVKILVDGIAEVKKNVDFLANIARAIGQRRQRGDDQRRLRQLLLAMHNYHDTYQSFPPSDRHRDDNGKPLLSWRVHILPFVEQAELYEEFHLDEPWDSEHNRKLIEKMPDIYATDLPADQDQPAAGRTTFLAPIGEGTIFGQDKPTKIQHVIDGTSNTVAVLIATPERAVPWTAPRDFEFDPDDPLNGVRLSDDGHWQCAFADGSSHIFRSNIAAEIVLHLFQMNDRNVVDVDGLR